MAKPRSSTLAIPGVVGTPPPAETAPAADVSDTKSRATINLTVDDAFKWEFREWCVRHRMSQVQAVREAFGMLVERHGR